MTHGTQNEGAQKQGGWRSGTLTSTRRLAIALAVTLGLAACGGSGAGDATDAGDQDGSSDLVNSNGTDDSNSDPDGINEDGINEENVAAGIESGLSSVVTFVVQGTTYEFTGVNCIDERGATVLATHTNFGADGVGTIDGTNLWGKVIVVERDMTGDGEPNISYAFEIEVGGEEGFQAPPGQPSLVLMAVDTDDPEVTAGFVYEPGRFSGSGELMDRNGVLADANEPIPFTFVATCA